MTKDTECYLLPVTIIVRIFAALRYGSLHSHLPVIYMHLSVICICLVAIAIDIAHSSGRCGCKSVILGKTGENVDRATDMASDHFLHSSLQHLPPSAGCGLGRIRQTGDKSPPLAIMPFNRQAIFAIPAYPVNYR